MTTLVECIPNVSEGRVEGRIEAMGALLDRPPGVALLHVHPDVDHHRTVYTTVGEPDALVEALVALYEAAVEAIDLRSHRGVHPRVGAVDVCPFVPLPRHGSDMELCRELAGRLAGEVGERLELPVFLYRESARHANRRDLREIRRGQFEGLEAKLADPAWRPDAGPDRPHATAGATVIGARGPLIAFNVVLDTADLAVARAVAAEVRASSGGLPGIKAMGVPLASRRLVQVSMNVEDPARTPLHVAVERVGVGAAGHGVKVRETELVGLMPLDDVAAAAASGLRLAEFGAERVLEEAIARRLHR